MCLGESGTGKSTALRNFKPDEVALIQIVRKPLPFRPAGWSVCCESHEGVLKKVADSGNIYCTDSALHICTILPKLSKDIIVIDDFQYLMANEFMNRSYEKGYDKFTEIARHAWDVINTASMLNTNKRVYVLSHVQTDENGGTRAKTIGKMLDEKITLEGLFTIVLRTEVRESQYFFRTENNGKDTVKSPINLFADSLIENDLSKIDTEICNYYGITKERINNV